PGPRGGLGRGRLLSAVLQNHLRRRLRYQRSRRGRRRRRRTRRARARGRGLMAPAIDALLVGAAAKGETFVVALDERPCAIIAGGMNRAEVPFDLALWARLDAATAMLIVALCRP